MSIAPIEEIVAAFARGETVIMVDDEDRENEGDLIIAAEDATPDNIGFMLRYSSGIICLPVVGERLDELEIPMMVAKNTDVRRTAFTISIDAAQGTTTGISARRSSPTGAACLADAVPAAPGRPQ
jgi:3,4-dihydroxy-2-butanone 4-phosphate synthase